ncbi:MAG TPA: 5-oxoprolinase subunit PxpA [Myxococcales bacterium]|nr:5-oxoprolinase subunit PxpA [Myxococcales bacterium]
MTIDLNADVGEGCDDESLLPFLTSANVACGMHAGGPGAMDRTVALALERGVRIGAHPGYDDRANFGRKEIDLPYDEVENLVLYQIAALDGFVRSRAGRLAHVKAHGALYNRAAREIDLARAIARGVRRYRQDLVLVGLAGSHLLAAAKELGLPGAGEAFADRRYLPNGALMPRSQPGSVLTNPADAADQALHIARDRFVTASDGSRLSVEAKTLCLHGDTPGAPRIAAAVRDALDRAGIRIAPLA